MTPEQFHRSTMETLEQRAFQVARQGIPSDTLRRALTIQKLSLERSKLHIPHYWAYYVHEGSAPVNMPRGRFMIWFKDPNKDPRLDGGITPMRYSRTRHLTRNYLASDEFKQLVKNDEVVIAQNRRAIEGRPFFSNQPQYMGPFVDYARTFIPANFRKEMIFSTEMRALGVGRIKKI